MKDRGKFLQQHAPGLNSVGGNGVLSQIDVVGAHIASGAPEDSPAFFEDFHNAQHFFVDGRTFKLSCCQLSREEGHCHTVLFDNSAQLMITRICMNIKWNVWIGERKKNRFRNDFLCGIKRLDKFGSWMKLSF